VQVGEPEPAVLLVDLHAEGAQPGQALEDLVGDARVALYPGAVDLGAREGVELAEELVGVRAGLLGGPGVDQVEPEPAEEELLAEAGFAPLGLASGLGHLPGLLFGDIALRRGHRRPPRPPRYRRVLPRGSAEQPFVTQRCSITRTAQEVSRASY
jgi:hypothetical protein